MKLIAFCLLGAVLAAPIPSTNEKSQTRLTPRPLIQSSSVNRNPSVSKQMPAIPAGMNKPILDDTKVPAKAVTKPKNKRHEGAEDEEEHYDNDEWHSDWNSEHDDDVHLYDKVYSDNND